MKKIILLSLVSIALVVPQLQCISLIDYVEQQGMPQIQGSELDLSHKNLTDLTGLQDIAHIDQVHKLHLHDNQLTTVPSGIFNSLRNLQLLDLSSNQLATLPKGAFTGLKSLIGLSLSNNKLRVLPTDIFNDLQNLRTLSLNNNQLQSLPATALDRLTKLKMLNLDNNQLTTLPYTIFNGVRGLLSLRLKDNPFNPNFIPALAEMIHSIPELYQLNNKLKSEAFTEDPFFTLKLLMIEAIAGHIEQYKDHLHELPADILDLLPINREQRFDIEHRQISAP